MNGECVYWELRDDFQWKKQYGEHLLNFFSFLLLIVRLLLFLPLSHSNSFCGLITRVQCMCAFLVQSFPVNCPRNNDWFFTKYYFFVFFFFDTRDEKVINLMKKTKKKKMFAQWSEERTRTEIANFHKSKSKWVLLIFVYKSFLLRQPTNQQKRKRKEDTHINFFFNLCVIRDDVKFHWAAKTERETETKVKTTLQHKNVICLPLIFSEKNKKPKQKKKIIIERKKEKIKLKKRRIATKKLFDKIVGASGGLCAFWIVL